MKSGGKSDKKSCDIYRKMAPGLGLAQIEVTAPPQLRTKVKGKSPKCIKISPTMLSLIWAWENCQ